MPFHSVGSMGDISFTSFFSLLNVERGEIYWTFGRVTIGVKYLKSGFVFFFGGVKGFIFLGGSIFGQNSVLFIGGKVCDFGSGVSLGLIKFGEYLLHQILKEERSESLPATFLINFVYVFPKPRRRRAKSKEFAINNTQVKRNI